MKIKEQKHEAEEKGFKKPEKVEREEKGGTYQYTNLN